MPNSGCKSVPRLHKLTYLYLQADGIPASECAVLCTAFGSLSNLTYLNLAYNDISDIGCGKIAKILPSSLQTLDLSCNPIPAAPTVFDRPSLPKLHVIIKQYSVPYFDDESESDNESDKYGADIHNCGDIDDYGDVDNGDYDDFDPGPDDDMSLIVLMILSPAERFPNVTLSF